MSKQLSDYILSITAILAIIAFIILYSIAMVSSWTSDTMPVFGASFQYLATALCGLVGGFAAKGLGTQVPQTGTISLQNQSRLSLLAERLKGVGTVVWPMDSEKIKAWLGGFYILVFALFGIIAALTWAIREATTAEMVKNLAILALGILIPSLSIFLSTSNFPSSSSPQ